MVLCDILAVAVVVMVVVGGGLSGIVDDGRCSGPAATRAEKTPLFFLSLTYNFLFPLLSCTCISLRASRVRVYQKA
jgi:hypothetical protein